MNAFAVYVFVISVPAVLFAVGLVFSFMRQRKLERRAEERERQRKATSRARCGND